MIAYLLLVHRFPNQFKRLFKAIYHLENHYVVHIDKRSGPILQEQIKEFLSHFPNTTLLKSENAFWGGYSLVDAELRGINKLLKMSNKWKFFINLSGQDFPLKSQEYIRDYLSAHPGKEFIKVLDQKKDRPDTLHRIHHYVYENANEVVSEPIIERKFIPNITPYIGNQWMILSREFCEFVTHSPEIKKFKDFYRNTLIADEGFFQTVMMNTSFKPQLVNDDLRAIDWIPMGTVKLRPRDFTANDADFLLASPDLFARKFDSEVDRQILGILEDSLRDKSLVIDKPAEPFRMTKAMKEQMMQENNVEI